MTKNRRNLLALAAMAMSWGLAACTEVRHDAFVSNDQTTPDTQVTEAVDPACTGCHGKDGSAAPPLDLRGRDADSARGVGAHAAHLENNTLGHDVACESCHTVPATIDAPGHTDSSWPAEVLFSGIAVADGAEPTLEAGQGPAATVTCSSTYCHGGTLTGGSMTSPAWNPPNPAATKCDSCHGFPPPGPHPAYDRCDHCHAPVVSPEGTIADRSLHINGAVDVLMFSECNACHGSSENPAPPVDLKGQNVTTASGVGAHQSHLKAAHELAAPVACSQCHKVPVSVGAPGHLDDGTVGADLTFGALATADGDVTPAYDRDAGTCSNTYCHGATLPGGAITAPVWTKVDDSQAACGSCHGVPPAEPHPQSHECGQCHPATAVGMTIAHPENHVNGTLDVAGGLACNSCHGNDQNYAPPVDTNGGAETTLVTVGAHQPHLLASSALSSPVACTACHLVPASVDAEGHLGASPAEVTFGTLATAGGVSPVFDRATATCSSTYCHGATLPGGTITVPVWTQVDDTQDACGACHGVPPPAPHVQLTTCGTCHAETAEGMTIAHPEKHIDGVLQVGTALACSTCHGNSENPAPPVDTHGDNATTLVTVGAHQSHIQATAGLSSPLHCTDCHVQPASVGDPDHLGPPPAEVQFGALASAGGALPAWDRTDGTCSSTYCHGATLPGGTVTTPIWTVVDGSQEACGACHGVPPPAPHVQLTSCGVCHAATAINATIAHPEKHINGQIEVDLDLSCSTCHGSSDNPAPPVDTQGGSATTLVTVGAHQPHVAASSNLSAPLHCTDCHVQPATVGQAGHLGPAPAEIEFGALASAHGTTPAWDRDSATCSSTYCHGATLPGGSNTSPQWTLVDNTEDACGSCHGVPPPAPHVQLTTCGTCHTATAVGATIAHPEKHIDGTLQVNTSLACNTCHGNTDNPAPPVDTTGGSTTTLVTVGAHQPHVAAAGGLAAPIDCDQCHVKPASMGDAGHLGAPPAEITFGALASAEGTSPAWDRTSATCSSTYCHGDTLSGGTDKTPVWTTVDGTQKTCDACHGNPPPAPHVQMADCGLCHPATAEGDAIAHPEKHVNGTLEVDLAQGCSACHGGPDNPAPPVDTNGGSATTLVTVGAHQAHVTADSNLATPLACDDCHVVPSNVGAPGHMDPGPAEVVFGELASGDGADPAWNHTQGTCSSTYCHGATLAGGNATTPIWTKVDDTQDTCGSCHGNPPPAPHVQLANCGACHAATATGGAVAHPDRHVDGTLDVDLNQACNACHGNADNAAPPVDTNGGSATTLKTVGAHQAHLKASSGLSSPVACATCHVVPNAVDAAGHLGLAPAEVSMTGLAAADGASPSWSNTNGTCSSTYCHGATLNAGGSITTPLWTKVDNTQDACGTCHGYPPPAPHTQLTNCGSCHPATAEGGAIAHPAKHIDGTLDVDLNQACNACHGSAGSNAPPVDTNGGSATTLKTVGAHQAHLQASSGLSSPVACTTCHVVPATVDAAGHLGAAPAEVSMTGLAAANGASPSWSNTNGTCSSTYCHGATLNAGGSITTPLWTKVDNTQDACGTCHGYPPPAPHAQQTNCGMCHSATATGGAIAHPAQHIDGTLDVDQNQACNACHGSAVNDAPPVDTNGGSATTLKTVGAHQAHLQASSALSSPVACTTCHVVPATVDAAGHLGAAPAEVTMTGLAASGGANPTWSNTAGTCSSTYCHGATLNAGGTVTSPLWTKVDNTQDTCGACHGAPPPAPHVSMTNCGLCHSATASGMTIAHPAKHIDGTLDTSLPSACNACHGSAGSNAPPVDTNGGSTTTSKTVGAHQAHLQATSAISSAVACNECHTVPATTSAAGHLDASPAELTFGTLANTGTANGVWNAAAGTCSTTYCHGATLNGGSNKTPLWTKVDNTQDACGTCHGLPPSSGNHGDHSGINCRECHNNIATTTTITGPALHINGVKDVALRSAGTWNGTTKSCDPACHGAETW